MTRRIKAPAMRIEIGRGAKSGLLAIYSNIQTRKLRNRRQSNPNLRCKHQLLDESQTLKNIVCQSERNVQRLRLGQFLYKLIGELLRVLHKLFRYFVIIHWIFIVANCFFNLLDSFHVHWRWCVGHTCYYTLCGV